MKLNEFKIELNTDKALRKACALVESEAKKKCPSHDGLLRMSITHRVDGDTGIIGTVMEYAPYVEYGTGLFAEAGNGRQTPWSYQDAEGNWYTTSGQSPQPYLRPALKENVDRIIEIFKEEIKVNG